VEPGGRGDARLQDGRARLARARLRGAAGAKATLVYTKYIITDMYAKAVQGMTPEDAVRWAEGEPQARLRSLTSGQVLHSYIPRTPHVAIVRPDPN